MAGDSRIRAPSPIKHHWTLFGQNLYNYEVFSEVSYFMWKRTLRSIDCHPFHIHNVPGYRNNCVFRREFHSQCPSVPNCHHILLYCKSSSICVSTVAPCLLFWKANCTCFFNQHHRHDRDGPYLQQIFQAFIIEYIVFACSRTSSFRIAYSLLHPSFPEFRISYTWTKQ